MMDLVSTSLTSGFLQWVFQPGQKLSVPLRYRFLVTGTVPSQTDIIVDGETARLEQAGNAPATTTFQCDTETYVLLIYGRHNLEAAMAVRRVVVAGDQQAIMRFSRWFKGIRQ